MNNHGILPNQQKIAEKLTLLNDRGIGMLARLSNLKKVCWNKLGSILMPTRISEVYKVIKFYQDMFRQRSKQQTSVFSGKNTGARLQTNYQEVSKFWKRRIRKSSLKRHQVNPLVS